MQWINIKYHVHIHEINNKSLLLQSLSFSFTIVIRKLQIYIKNFSFLYKFLQLLFINFLSTFVFAFIKYYLKGIPYIYTYKTLLNHPGKKKLNSDHMNVISMNFYGEGESKNWLESKERKLERSLGVEPNRGGNKVSIGYIAWTVCHCHLSKISLEDWLRIQHASNERLQTMSRKRYTTFFDIARFVSSCCSFFSSFF